MLDNIGELLFFPNWMKVLCLLESHNTTTLVCKGSNISFANVYLIVKQLESKGLVNRDKKGRSVYITLTTKGLSVCENINKMCGLLKK